MKDPQSRVAIAIAVVLGAFFLITGVAGAVCWLLGAGWPR